jgi:hypothetical protein
MGQCHHTQHAYSGVSVVKFDQTWRVTWASVVAPHPWA